MSSHRNLLLLIISHVLIICLSNILVQYPFLLFGYKTTWGAFSYPLIFILTDLSTRLTGAVQARKIIFLAMIPGLVGSFLITNYIQHGSLLVSNTVALRIALASFSAYVIGQLADILLFQKLRKKKQWWIAPSIANVVGNVIDTYCFFIIAFYHGTNPFLSQHWPEIATVDLVFKLVISLASFVPLYGIILAWVLRKQARLQAAV